MQSYLNEVLARSMLKAKDMTNSFWAEATYETLEATAAIANLTQTPDMTYPSGR